MFQLELAVHKKKVAELQDFLQQSFNKKSNQVEHFNGAVFELLNCISIN